MNEARPHTTIGLRKATKIRLDKARAPGQCYDGFLCQLVDFWQEAHIIKNTDRDEPKGLRTQHQVIARSPANHKCWKSQHIQGPEFTDTRLTSPVK